MLLNIVIMRSIIILKYQGCKNQRSNFPLLCVTVITDLIPRQCSLSPFLSSFNSVRLYAIGILFAQKVCVEYNTLLCTVVRVNDL